MSESVHAGVSSVGRFPRRIVHPDGELMSGKMEEHVVGHLFAGGSGGDGR